VVKELKRARVRVKKLERINELVMIKDRRRVMVRELVMRRDWIREIVRTKKKEKKREGEEVGFGEEKG